MSKEKTYINREISWLSFNERVLQEAADPVTPLIERLKFLGIFSSNLDEFFRVRVATIKRIMKEGKKAKVLLGENPVKIFNEIEQTVIKQQETFDEIYRNILKELEKNKVFIINEKQLTSEQGEHVKEYFHHKVRPTLFPVMIDNLDEFPVLHERSIYLAIRLRKKSSSRTSKHAIIEVPSQILSRFLVLPEKDGNTFIILLDDVIRFSLDVIFSMFGFTIFEAYTIKLTRDAELDFDDDITMSFFEIVSKSLKQRKKGSPVRFIYDCEIPLNFLKILIKKNNLTGTDTLIPGGRYHNFKDFMNFPSVGLPDLHNNPMSPLPHKDLDTRKSILSAMRKKDILLHFPYQSFHYVTDLLREASLDPRVISIKMTLYRVANNSSVVNALIRAVRNGKSVTVVMELQARFDEEANIFWTNRLREEGAHIIHGVPNLKVHSKMCLITRKEKNGLAHYVNIGTGNYNENTARLYSDHSLLTVDKRISREVIKLFNFFVNNYKTGTYKYLLVSPFTLRKKLNSLIKNEIKNAQNGKEAYMIIKVNSLFDKQIIDNLYAAGRAGVKIRLIVRGVCSLIPGVEGLSDNISVVSILDRFLEHSRIFVFCNGGDEKYYISSADWMVRNIDRRVEVTCPVYDKKIQEELRNFLDIQLRDNTKAREITAAQDNSYKRELENIPVRAQIDFYNFMKGKIEAKQLDEKK
ncbi:MAG: polyphosphate kinase 1 [Candidatus Latescibacteria bacterium]|jgi:polyphosphate kinase|nr:polyphosphate kinase 1 [Candidatus Latescibacterota bacterium]